MPFEFVLTFTGLCVLIYDQDHKNKPKWAKVLLADADHLSPAHRHVRLMSFDPNTLASDSKPPKDYRLVPSPDGNDCGLFNVDNDVKVIHPSGELLTASWKPLGAPAPETALDWLAPMYAINQNAPGITPPDAGKENLGLSGQAATVDLKGGSLEAGDLTKSADGTYVPLKFVYQNGTGESDDTQVLADKLHLRMRKVESAVTIEGVGWTAKFAPPKDTPLVRVSITNLPEIPADPKARLEHFGHNYDMVKWSKPKPDLRLPALPGGVVTGSSGVCPPTRWDG